MKIVLAAYGWENIGIGYLAALAKLEGHTVELLFDDGLFSDYMALSLEPLRHLFDPWPQMKAQLAREKPDIVGINIFTSGYLWARGLARRIRSMYPQTVIVGGGSHVTVAPHTVLQKRDEFDAVLVGEGEIAWLELLRRFKADAALPHDIRGLWVKGADGSIVENGWGDVVENLDELPFSDKEIFAPYYPHAKTYGIITSRGCPYACSFCQNNAFKRQYGNTWSRVRHRSPDNVLEELLQARRTYRFESVHFVDDCFTSDKKWLKRFLHRYGSEIGLPFRCVNHPATLDEERIRQLKDAGCYSVVIGVQDWNAEVRRGLYGRYESDDQIRAAFAMAEKAGLHIIANQICGSPAEKPADLARACAAYASLKISRIATFHLTYFPGADITGMARDLGWIDDGALKRIYEGECSSYHGGGSIESPEQLKNTRGFEFLMHLFPLLPRAVKRRLSSVGSIRFFSHFPLLLMRLVDLFVTLASRDSEAMLYLSYYRRNIKRRMAQACACRHEGRSA